MRESTTILKDHFQASPPLSRTTADGLILFLPQARYYVHKSTELERVPAASGMVQELTSLSLGYAFETQLDSKMDVGDATAMHLLVDVEEMDLNTSKLGKRPYTNNLHF
jgi:hypothetical protein